MRERNTRIPRVPKTVKRPHRNMGFFFYTGMDLECIRKLHCASSEKHPPHSIVCKTQFQKYERATPNTLTQGCGLRGSSKMKRFHFYLIFILNKYNIMIKEELKKLHETEIGNIYSAKSLAEALGCSSRLVHYFRTKGKLKSINTTRNRFLFVKEDVIDFLKEKGYAS